jgi:hypothetical protein
VARYRIAKINPCDVSLRLGSRVLVSRLLVCLVVLGDRLTIRQRLEGDILRLLVFLLIYPFLFLSVNSGKAATNMRNFRVVGFQVCLVRTFLERYSNEAIYCYQIPIFRVVRKSRC